MAEFDINASTQRMDSTFIEAHIKQLTRLDLLGRVVHNFHTGLLEDLFGELPDGIEEFAELENLELSYDVAPVEARAMMETLAQYAAWLADRFVDDAYTDLQGFDHLQRVLDEQCYRIPQLEAVEEERCEEDNDNDDSPGWEPIRSISSNRDADDDEGEEAQPHAELKPPQRNRQWVNPESPRR